MGFFFFGGGGCDEYHILIINIVKQVTPSFKKYLGMK